MESFLQDLKHSIRMFLNAPGFALTAVLALALGVGANTAIFSLINTVLLRPVNFPDPDRIVGRFGDEFEKLLWITLMSPWPAAA